MCNNSAGQGLVGRLSLQDKKILITQNKVIYLFVYPISNIERLSIKEFFISSTKTTVGLIISEIVNV